MTRYLKPKRKIKITRKKLYNRLRRVWKALYHRTRPGRRREKTILFIVGCQRSGTTLMTRIFENDLNTKVYPEVSKLSSEDADRQLRLNPLPRVKAVLEKDRAPLIILKPLVESQRILELLDYFQASKALWLFRDYRDVAHSHVRKWGGQNSIRDLQAIVEARPDNWRYENLPDRTRRTVLRFFSKNMDPYDAAALYWFVRNSLFFDLRLGTNPRVLLCRYADLALDPARTMAGIYSFLDHEFPDRKIVESVHAESVRKGRRVRLSSPIERLCRELHERLVEQSGVAGYSRVAMLDRAG